MHGVNPSIHWSYCINNYIYRLSYAVWLLQEIVQHQPQIINIKVMYDIACVALSDTFKDNTTILFREFSLLSPPSMHMGTKLHVRFVLIKCH